MQKRRRGAEPALLVFRAARAGGADDRVNGGAEDGGAEKRGERVGDEVRKIPGEVVIAIVARMGEERGGGGERKEERETAGSFHEDKV